MYAVEGRVSIAFREPGLADGGAAQRLGRAHAGLRAAVGAVHGAQVRRRRLAAPRDGHVVRALALVDRRLLQRLPEAGLVLHDALERDHGAVVDEEALLGAVRAGAARLAHGARHLPEALVARDAAA
ncbi:MAG TPA: hypothetical protein VNX21_06220, partial [Candidatus Thermoplasmatota archaeon]|nr:hypothetical protein [Candidatus Thermoplasmatota archaeon]